MAAPGDDPSATSGDSRPSTPLSMPARWIFLTGNRLVLAGGIMVGVYLLVLLSPFAGDIARDRLSPLNYLFSALVGGNFTLITIVISINQLVISRQLGTPGDLRDRIESTNAYRQAIEEAVDVDVSPVTPTEFLHLLVHRTRDSLETVQDEAAGLPDPDARDELESVVGEVEVHVDRVEAVVSREEIGLFEALAATLDTNYSQDIYHLRQLRAEWGQTHSDQTMDRLDDLVVRLQQIDVARQYLKTLYMQEGLSRLSLRLLYVGVPAVLVSVLMLRAFAAVAAPQPSPALSATVPVAVTIALAPLAVLVAYVLRLATVARRTVAITPFTLSSQERRPSLDLDRTPGDD